MIGEYDGVLVVPPPLPPHERPWRHPSELGPTAADVDTTPHGWGIALTAGTLLVALVALVVVATTPAGTSDPVALDATTLPAFVSTPAPASTPAPSSAPVQAVSATGTEPTGASFVRLSATTQIPAAVAAAPRRSAPVAADPPRPTETVVVLAEAGVYRVAWHDLTRHGADELGLPSRALVLDLDGHAVATILDGDLAVLSPDD